MNKMTVTELQAYIFRCMREIEAIHNTKIKPIMDIKSEAIRILEEKEKAEK